jgi:poly(A) polymerase
MSTGLEKIASGSAVRLIAGLAGEFGVKAYLAGGGVRDCLLGRRVNDLDFALSGAFAELPRLFAERWGGTFFWLDEERLQSRVVKKVAGETQVHDFAPLRGTTIEDDLRLRDFTINALAMPVIGAEAELIDPLQGEPDLRGKIIRACTDRAFDDDPLRLLRALRFVAELGFIVEESTWNALRQKAALLGGVAAERIRDELFRILAAPGVGAALEKLDESGLLGEIFPAESLLFAMSRAAGEDRQAMNRHIGRAVAVERVCGELERLFPGRAAQLAGYLNTEVESGISVLSLMKLAAFLGREPRDGSLVLVKRLRLGRKAGGLLELFCRDASSVFEALEHTAAERARFRFFRDREPAGPGMVLIALADGTISNVLSSQLLGYFAERYDHKEGCLLISGEEIMDLLGIGEGVEVGEAMERLREAECCGIVNSREDAREFLRKNLLTKPVPMR